MLLLFCLVLLRITGANLLSDRTLSIFNLLNIESYVTLLFSIFLTFCSLFIGFTFLVFFTLYVVCVVLLIFTVLAIFIIIATLLLARLQVLFVKLLESCKLVC